MGFKYSFIDSEVYGTEDVNAITSNLVGAGVAPFLSKESYSVPVDEYTYVKSIHEWLMGLIVF